MGNDRTILGYGRFEPDFTMCNCMMSFVEVEVDTETGKVDLIRVVNATDVGQIIDPHGLEGQLNGCLGSAGIDSAIFEETILDRRTGHIVNANMIDYKWRTFAELPVIENVVLETPFPSHRFHAVGVGEISTSPGPSAVLMAVSNAVGDVAARVSGDARPGYSRPWRRPRAQPGRERSQRRCEMKPFTHHNARSIREAVQAPQSIRRKGKGQRRGHRPPRRHEGQEPALATPRRSST